MAFTKIVGAGIHTLSNVHSHNINSSGIITATSFVGPFDGTTGDFSGNVTVGGNFTVNGTTTTLDTQLVDVDKIEVTTAGTNVAVAVTHNGTGDLVRLYDGSTQVVTVDDVGQVGIGTAIPDEALQLGNNKKIHFGLNGIKAYHTGSVGYINNSTGILRITGASGQKIDFIDGSGTNYYARFNSGNSCELFYVGSGAKLITKSYGVQVTGSARATTGGDGYTFINDPDTGMHNPSDGNLHFKVNGTDRISMDSSGISTFHNSRLHIEGAGSGNTPLTINSDNATNNSVHPLIEAYADNSSRKARIGLVREASSAALGWGFFTNANTADPEERLRITSGGKIGIGNFTSINPARAVHLHEASGGTAIYATFTNGSTGTAASNGFTLGIDSAQAAILNNYSNTDIKILCNGSERLRIDSSGRIQIGSSTLPARNNFDGIGRLNVTNNSADGTVDYTQGMVFSSNASNEGTWTQAAIVTTGSSGYNGNLIFATDGSGARDNAASNLTERLRLDSSGFIGINDTTPYNGLTINKEGDYWDTNGNTYAHPVGRVLSSWRGDRNDNTDYWVGFVGKYMKPSATVNILLQPHVGNFGNQAGMYIAGEATGNYSSDFTLGKIVSGSQAGRGTSGNQRATKSELFRITNSGNVKFNSGFGSVTVVYGCRAWIQLNQSGSQSINGSGGVSSIADLGTGHTQVNFATAMPDDNYAMVGGAQQSSNGGVNYGFSLCMQTRNTGNANFIYRPSASSDTKQDNSLVDVAFFR